jgi:hypothetical protein
MRPRATAFAFVLAVAACAPDPGKMEREARELVFKTLSQPDQPVVVGPVVMQDKFAVVDWTRGGLFGGRTLLRRDGKAWTMILCGGPPLRQRPTLIAAGVPDGTAGVLATKLMREELRLGDRRDQIEKWRAVRTDGVKVACPEPKPR